MGLFPKRVNGYAIERGADLRDSDLTGADLRDSDLTGADLSGANLEKVSSGGITGTAKSLPQGWRMLGGYLVGPNADLSDADLFGASLSDCLLYTSDAADE